MRLHRCGLRGLSGRLSSFVYYQGQSPSFKNTTTSLTLTASPTQSDPAAPDGETLHLFDCPFCIWLADELNESAVFPSRNLDLHTNENGQSCVSNPSK